MPIKQPNRWYINFGKILFIILLTLLSFQIPMPRSKAFGEGKIKQANVSGQFYSTNAKELSGMIDAFLAGVPLKPYDKHIDIIIAPHAGYLYSGAVAAHSFKAVSQNQYKTIVILAPSHYLGFDGISIWDEGAFQTPLGLAQVDSAFTQKLLKANPNFYFEPKAFEREHSLEVEIPFLQKTFTDFKIVPVIMGQPSVGLLEEFAKTLKEIIGDRKDVLIVVSTDMSHYHDDAMARQMDARTLAAIKSLDVEKFWAENYTRTMEMCGFVPVTAALLYAKQNGLNHVDILRYANSGDVTDDKSRVVGYSAIVIYGDKAPENLHSQGQENKKLLNKDQKKRLLEIARHSIQEFVESGKIIDVLENDERLKQEEGAFVTIHKMGKLRGCIGNIIGRGPLYITVRDMAIAAASEDPRFEVVSKDEIKDIDIEVSVLSLPKLISTIDDIQMGVHGVIVRQGVLNQGVFLPQVATETGWSKKEFLSQLCSQKAGLSPDCWKDSRTKIYIFTAQVFSQKDVDKGD